MATITVYLRTKPKLKKGVYPLYVKIRSRNSAKPIPVGFSIPVSSWDNVAKKVIKHPDKEIINAKIDDIKSDLNKKISDAILNNRAIDVKRITKPGSKSFTEYLENRAKQYDISKQKTMAGRVRYAAGELIELFNNVLFEDVSADTLRTYHAYLKKNHAANTIHKRFSMLRQLFSNAVDEGHYSGGNPFKGFKVKTVPVKKEKLSAKEIASLEKQDLDGMPAVARDMFLLSYYAKGIRFENVVFLHHRDIKAGRIYIKTNKGEEFLSIKVHDKLKVILDRYPGKGYIFPFATHIPDEKRKFLDSVNIKVNRALKIAAAAAGINTTLSFHISRHSLAQELKAKGVSTTAIKDILGHSSVAITERYLRSLDDENLDKEMNKVYK